MNESERVLDIYVKQQQEKINELAQQVLLLSTKNQYLKERLEQTELELKRINNINKKEANSVESFKYVPEVQNRKDQTYKASKNVKEHKKQHNFKHEKLTIR
jgi:multidrug resistance efflux pump